jgi:hypothetical protein
MKMVKSLLLGTAAGLVAVAGAQAADMPVKAAPVQYVKICTLYGDGFYYIPGTDICLKIGGYVRVEYFYNYGADGTAGPFQAGAVGSGYKDRFDGADFEMRTRAYAWFDSRQKTEYGTLRSYLQIGVNYDSPEVTSTNFDANRAFIQFAGFTIGTAQSFFDFYSPPASSYFIPPSSSTGSRGWKVFAYRAVRQRFLGDVLVRRSEEVRDRGSARRRHQHEPRQPRPRRQHQRHRSGEDPVPGHRAELARRPGLGQCPAHGRGA